MRLEKLGCMASLQKVTAADGRLGSKSDEIVLCFFGPGHSNGRSAVWKIPTKKYNTLSFLLKSDEFCVT
jgi:hypothetical protein